MAPVGWSHRTSPEMLPQRAPATWQRTGVALCAALLPATAAIHVQDVPCAGLLDQYTADIRPTIATSCQAPSMLPSKLMCGRSQSDIRYCLLIDNNETTSLEVGWYAASLDRFAESLKNIIMSRLATNASMGDKRAHCENLAEGYACGKYFPHCDAQERISLINMAVPFPTVPACRCLCRQLCSDCLKEDDLLCDCEGEDSPFTDDHSCSGWEFCSLESNPAAAKRGPTQAPRPSSAVAVATDASFSAPAWQRMVRGEPLARRARLTASGT